MQKVLLILGLVLILAVVEQTTGQKCSLEYCRKWPRSNCKCRGCCWGKLSCRDGSCEKHYDFSSGKYIHSCFCYQCHGAQHFRLQSGGSGANETSNGNSTKTAS